MFAAKKLFVLVTSDHRSQSHLKFQSCLTTEYAGDCFLVKAFSFLDFFLEAIFLKKHVGLFDIFFKVF